jgi:hypothetical protein
MVEFYIWGVFGPWQDRRHSGAFYCNLSPLPSGINNLTGASVVTGGAGGLLVPSTVIWAIIPRGRILTVGRISGYWKDTRPAGTFSCILYHYPSWNITNVGASIVVHGGIDWKLVYSVVICFIIHRSRLLLLGRSTVYSYFLMIYSKCDIR